MDEQLMAFIVTLLDVMDVETIAARAYDFALAQLTDELPRGGYVSSDMMFQAAHRVQAAMIGVVGRRYVSGGLDERHIKR